MTMIEIWDFRVFFFFFYNDMVYTKTKKKQKLKNKNTYNSAPTIFNVVGGK